MFTNSLFNDWNKTNVKELNDNNINTTKNGNLLLKLKYFVHFCLVKQIVILSILNDNVLNRPFESIMATI